MTMRTWGNLNAKRLLAPNKILEKADNQVGRGGFSYLGSPFIVVSSQCPSATISCALIKCLASIIDTCTVFKPGSSITSTSVQIIKRGFFSKNLIIY